MIIFQNSEHIFYIKKQINLFLYSDVFLTSEKEMLRDLNKKPSTNLSKRKKRDKLTINWQMNHGFKNLFDKYPHQNDKMQM